MSTIPKRLYRKGIHVKTVTDSVEAAALVADGYTASEFVDDLSATGVDGFTQAEHDAEKASHKGTTAARPVKATVGAGFAYFDTTLNKPVWVKADLSGWVDATGSSA